jgi:hypothetical protein
MHIGVTTCEAQAVYRQGVIVGFIPTIPNHCRALLMDVRNKCEHDARVKGKRHLTLRRHADGHRHPVLK